MLQNKFNISFFNFLEYAKEISYVHDSKRRKKKLKKTRFLDFHVEISSAAEMADTQSTTQPVDRNNILLISPCPR